MKSKSSKKKANVGNSASGAQNFIVWHGEKIVVGIVVVVALWFALQGLGYHALSWQPSELEKASTDAENGIRNSTRGAADEEIEIFDYAAYAEQIKEPISAAPYRTESSWSPVIHNFSRPSAVSPQE